MWWKISVILFLALTSTSAQRDCSKNEYDRCIKIADPLVREAHLVFPDNLKDIDLVCRAWSTFVDCLKAYTENCFTDQQRKQFNKAVESPIESVHQMCMQPNYRKEYLQYAPCIKSTIIEKIHCGPHYSLLVDQAEQGDVISKATLCCSHERFKQCVLKETRRLCDRGISDGPAARFASQIIDKALRFMQEQCINNIPNSADCTSPHDSLPSYSDRSDPFSVINTASSEVYPWSTQQQERFPKVASSTPSSWAISSSGSPSRAEADNSIFPTQNLGTRTRPGSYGRSYSWPIDPSSTTTEASVQSSTPQYNKETMASWDLYNRLNNINNRNSGKNPPTSYRSSPTENTPSTTTNRYDYSSTPFWNPSTSETWYPAAGNQLTNEVDEPNQLGLKKPQNSGFRSEISGILGLLVVIINVLRTM
ncbi:unnamed protein product [Ceutorhynchus assimilis]|uniref:Uncharacterized protein n=1 Tax=Ceutorhynchus assimilis TaxID=467358 RepID=A0A9N9MUK6_9CUCU|nr:unnamed protein product [Ceutorhynchus assimilis]